MQILMFLLQLCAAVMLLLYSTRMVRTGVERAAGSSLRDLFNGTRQNVFLNVCAGTFGAVLLQSSTAIALLVSSFAATGAMGITGSLAVVLGADFGTAIVVQFLSLNLVWLTPALLSVGGLLFLKFDSRTAKQIGRIFIGIGFLLLSLKMLGEASGPMRESTVFPVVVQYLGEDIITAFIGGALIAFFFHSSVAAILLFAVFAGQGILPLAAGLPLVLGANVGGGMVAVWLTRNMHVKARRITLANLIFRLGGGLLALAALGWALLPLDQLGSTPARQMVNFHFLFNAALVLVCLPLVIPLARLVKLLVQENGGSDLQADKPQIALDYGVLDSPNLALASATRELLRMSEQIEIMFAPLMEIFDTSIPEKVQQIRDMDESINESHTEIKLYLAKLNQQVLTQEQSQTSMELINFAISLERVGDIICKDLLRLSEVKHKEHLRFSDSGRKELSGLHSRVMANIQLALNVLISEDLESARQLANEKEEMRQLEQRSHDRHMERLGSGNAESIATSDIHLEVIQGTKEINSRFVSFAYPVLARYGLLMTSRVSNG
ncbi:MAG: Na/Pi cotransporter family protein [Rhizobiaceae bacterium]|nr:Na/Pi cotransporter family protein [Rhizobiaceae bacterium]